MCEFELVWFVTMWMIVFAIVLVEYFFPNGEGVSCHALHGEFCYKRNNYNSGSF